MFVDEFANTSEWRLSLVMPMFLRRKKPAGPDGGVKALKLLDLCESVRDVLTRWGDALDASENLSSSSLIFAIQSDPGPCFPYQIGGLFLLSVLPL